MIGSIDDSTREFINNRTDAVLGQQFQPGSVSGTDPGKINVGSPYGSMNDAISKRSAAQFYDPEQIRGMQKLDYAKQRGNQLKRQAEIQNRQYQLDSAAAAAMGQRAAQEEAQRNAILGSVLQIGLTVAGGAFGGPAGAAGGAAIGGAIKDKSAQQGQGSNGPTPGPYSTSSGYNTSGRVPQRQMGGY